MDLDAIKARAAAATPGPWYVERGGEHGDPFWAIAAILRDPYGDNSLSCGSDREVAEFIAHARTDVPALVAEVERLEAALLAADRVISDGADKQLVVYACPVHGEVWRYLGPEDFNCVYCLKAAAE